MEESELMRGEGELNLFLRAHGVGEKDGKMYFPAQERTLDGNLCYLNGTCPYNVKSDKVVERTVTQQGTGIPIRRELHTCCLTKGSCPVKTDYQGNLMKI